MSTLTERRDERKAEAEALAKKSNELSTQIEKLTKERDQIAGDFYVKNAQYAELEDQLKEQTPECSVDTPPEG
tara:strand:+ start:372 stop:590 length:219 start_codon:yes stop_codon:yes gene_type:complete